jgi:hypothetical protein
VERHLLEEVAESHYRKGAKSVEVFGNSISAATAGRVLMRVGGKLHEELFGPESMVRARESAPPNPPALLVIQADGSRYRTNEADGPRREEGAGTEDRGWRENKIGVVIRSLRGEEKADGSYDAPRELVKTYLGSVDGIEPFGRDLRTEAERRGVREAEEVVIVSDGGHGLPGMFGREFPGIPRITDYFHSAKRLAECARLVCGEGEVNKKKRDRLYGELKDLLWNGKVRTVAKKLSRRAGKLAPRPEELSELNSKPEARALWEHVMYFEKNKGTMDYASYRARGWPVSSSSAESACGQFGDRVCHARMRWTTAGRTAGPSPSPSLSSRIRPDTPVRANYHETHPGCSSGSVSS